MEWAFGNNRRTKSLPGSIVGRWNSRIKQNPEHNVTILVGSLSKCSRLGWQVLLLGQGQYSILVFEHNPVDFDTVPKFQEKDPNLSESLRLAIWDIGLLVLFNMVFFATSWTGRKQRKVKNRKNNKKSTKS
jgi:hypothetical protein